MKRGQITLFIVVGLLILIFVLFITFSNKKNETLEKTPLVKADDVSLFITSCLQKEIENGLVVVSSQGGYYHLPPQSFASSEGLLPYYFNINNSMQRSLSQKKVEEQIGLYISDNIQNCFHNFSSFPEKRIIISSEEKYADIQLSDGRVLAKLFYPISMTENNKKQNLQFFTAIVPIDALKLIELSQEYLDAQMKNQEGIPLDSVVHLKEKYNISLSVLFIEENAILTFFDEKIKIQDTPLLFRFAVKYNVTRQNVSEE